ncbi:helix-turn-helix transcriptional regulator [Paenibacillus gallinarum]|uniref:Helix-turn-helix transcriptional regulator n=1 Tax=Paenibacillus gallinarum TaxID=2762232 RepID=A0ABR8SU46_9BACL|nr:AraC family transcriptional regulator [Paenibacillus gallinarum]MBD7967015.1 helix-turn-helix transcriptional regulator [Paenibacillus gallinarum]
MSDRIEPKHMIGEHAFSIQLMKKSGISAMKRPHSHPYYELYYLLDGERVYFMNGSVYTARKGDMMVVNPDDFHSTASSDVPEFERVLVSFSHQFFTEGNPRTGVELPFRESLLLRFTLKEQPFIEHLLRQMLKECREQPLHYVAYVRSLLAELLIHLDRHLHSDQTKKVMIEDRNPMHAKVSEIANYINEHYAQPLTLEQLARQFYISPSYLSRIFSKLTGFHFKEYLQVVRIREAQKRLAETRDKVQSIAEQTGFEHINHFNKTFKKLTGTSPLRYRKQHCK